MIKEPVIRLRQPGGGEDSLPDSLHPVLKRILLSRGIHTQQDLDLDLKSMESPSSLSGLKAAAGLLADAIVQGHWRIVPCVCEFV